MRNTFALLLALGLAACATAVGNVSTPSSPAGTPSSPYGVTYYLNGSSSSGTHVYLERGMGGYALGPGVDQIGAKAARVPGVTRVVVAEYTQGQAIADLANRDPPTVKVVIGGYSCGANGAPGTAAAVARTVDMLPVIQASLWCGDYPIPRNVMRAQETYNPACAQTAGLGCKLLSLAPGFPPSHFLVIDRPDCHPCADTDPNAQNDVIDAIRSVTNAGVRMAISKQLGASDTVRRVTLYSGERLGR